MRLVLQTLADGVVIGAIIGLGAAGLTVGYAILRFANFAHGEFISWGAYLALAALPAFGAAAPFEPFSFGWPLLAALVIAAGGTATIALGIDRLLFSPLARKGQAIALVIASFGVALILRNLLLFVWGGAARFYSTEIQIAVTVVPRSVWGGLRVTPDQLAVLGLALAAMAALHLFLTRTTAGRAMRATAENPELARVAGVDTAAVARLTWALGAALAALAGVMAGVTIQLRPALGFELLLPMFAAAILGSIGNVFGAVAGGLIVGLAESASVPLIGAEYRAATAMVVLTMILLVRPTGLFGERGE
jgi:branched-chain amino acid transport system permease protein